MDEGYHERVTRALHKMMASVHWAGFSAGVHAIIKHHHVIAPDTAITDRCLPSRLLVHPKRAGSRKVAAQGVWCEIVRVRVLV